eukprot:931409-Karenia_brevis.AAC.1
MARQALFTHLIYTPGPHELRRGAAGRHADDADVMMPRKAQESAARQEPSIAPKTPSSRSRSPASCGNRSRSPSVSTAAS